MTLEVKDVVWILSTTPRSTQFVVVVVVVIIIIIIIIILQHVQE